MKPSDRETNPFREANAVATRDTRFFLCKNCGNLVGIIRSSGAPLICAPEAGFALDGDRAVAVYACCNLHGLWKADLCR